MGLFDDLNKALRQATDEIKKSGLDQRMKDLEPGLSNTGNNFDPHQKSPLSGQAGMTVSRMNPTVTIRQPHPGYTKIVVWVKRKFGSAISGISDPYQKKLELEQISAEACSGLSSKTKKGFLDYLKSQNYEQLLK